MISRFIGGVLLVAGTAIGAGMLALPVLTAMGGFYPSLALFIAVWAGTLFTALLVLEANLWFKKEVNFITMARHTLGKSGEIVAWIFFLALLYSLTAAYLAGSGAILENLGLHLPDYLEPLPLLIIFGVFVYLGTHTVDIVNRILMIGLSIAYIGLMTTVMPYIDSSLFNTFAPMELWAAIPVVVTSFGFHIIVPVLTDYLKRDVKSVRWAIIIGSLIPLVIYVLWEAATLGVVPISYMHQDELVTHSLSRLLQHPWIHIFAESFSFFAILTSFLGVSLSLSRFLADGLKIKKTMIGKLLLIVLTFIPPLVFVYIYPRGFILALQYAGAIVAILSGILPALMVWRGRKIHTEDVQYKVKGGTISLVLAIVFSLLVIVIELTP